MLSMGGGKKEAPVAKPTLQQVKESVNIGASSKCVLFFRRVLGRELTIVMHGCSVGWGTCREEEDLYVPTKLRVNENGLSTTDQDEQHQAVYCGSGEGFKALSLLYVLLSRRCSWPIDLSLHFYSSCASHRRVLCAMHPHLHALRPRPSLRESKPNTGECCARGERGG